MSSMRLAAAELQLVGPTISGTPPSRLIAEPNDSRVRVDGLAK